MPAPPHLSRNFISLVGWLIVCVIGAVLAVLVVTDILFYSEDVYKSIITYMILPGFLMFGVSVVMLGIFLEWRRRHKRDPGEYPALPVVNMNFAWQRRRVFIGAVLLSLVFAGSAVAVYRGYHFTESIEFCGEVCHYVMEPEHTAYQHSPHARVPCVACHIGPGAEWFVKSKISGLYQVYSVLTKSYELPIEVPVANLRPAQDTCEACHWPEKFSDSIERVIWHFSPDQANTPMRYNLLLKVGGGDPELGRGAGIHWHSSDHVQLRYWPRDEKRLEIPWVEVTVRDQEPRVFRSPD
ncbi:NapC/NirT family cytochrome c, partial [bacterium]|nr:NapC/NirT family cytochrome c [bacterium]